MTRQQDRQADELPALRSCPLDELVPDDVGPARHLTGRGCSRPGSDHRVAGPAPRALLRIRT